MGTTEQLTGHSSRGSFDSGNTGLPSSFTVDNPSGFELGGDMRELPRYCRRNASKQKILAIAELSAVCIRLGGADGSVHTSVLLSIDR